MVKDILFIIALLLPPLVAGIFKLWFLLGTFVLFYVCFGVMELISKKKTGDTISQSVWKIGKVKGLILSASMVIMWGFLVYHFLQGIW